MDGADVGEGDENGTALETDPKGGKMSPYQHPKMNLRVCKWILQRLSDSSKHLSSHDRQIFLGLPFVKL